MTQYFEILSSDHLNTEPEKAFVWSEDDNGYEKYGFIFSSSVLGCLKQIEAEIYEEEFEININVSSEHGCSYLITNLEDLYTAKLKYLYLYLY